MTAQPRGWGIWPPVVDRDVRVGARAMRHGPRVVLKEDRGPLVDSAARAVAEVPELLNVPLQVLAADLREKFGLHRAESYQAIARARTML